jgi:hypothetical protein
MLDRASDTWAGPGRGGRVVADTWGEVDVEEDILGSIMT